MKKIIPLLLAVILLAGCAATPAPQLSAPTGTGSDPVPESTAAAQPTTPPEEISAPEYVSRFDSVTTVTLSDGGITADSDAVYPSADIIYYEDKTAYDSGNPYGEGEVQERHTAAEAAAHTVVNITAPGAYRITGTLSAGQIRIDLGEKAYDDPNAVVELILDNCDITCTVAPAILFLNTYECDGSWSVDTARPDVDTADAGANLILEGENSVTGSHVARIFQDQEEEKKLWKQDGAIYSYMSMNVFGPGSLNLTADNEGLDTELHLTVNGGDITILAGNDGINTNEDGVSVTTVNGGNLHIVAGLGAEGDGIDSNGYLVINGGTVTASANPAADAGLDADLGSFIHGGTVIAMGSNMTWAESDSDQVTMNLQFASPQKAGSRICVTGEDGSAICSFEAESPQERSFSGLILSHPAFVLGETYHISVDGVQMAYTGSDMPMGPGGFGGGQPPQGEIPQGFGSGSKPEGFGGQDPGNSPEDFTVPEGEMPTMPEGKFPQQGFGGHGQGRDHFAAASGEPSTEFYMADKVNLFSGLTPA